MDSAAAKSCLPQPKELEALLDLQRGSDVSDLLADSLLNPLAEFLSRPGKEIRGGCVPLGFALAAAGDSEISIEGVRLCPKAAEIVEMIHAASLVVDDIQDASDMRRGVSTLHRQYGLPLALNAGNWLYFWPFEKIRALGLDSTRELTIYRLAHETLMRAHFGQALDLGVSIDLLEQTRIPSVCLASLELKTGALMAFGIALGGILGGASPSRLQVLRRFGHEFGIALQMFDDIGNLFARPGTVSKQYEDLRLKRPSWIWAVAAEELPGNDFAQFREAAVKLPEDSDLTKMIAQFQLVTSASGKAQRHLDQAVQDLILALADRDDHAQTLAAIFKLAERLTHSYGPT